LFSGRTFICTMADRTSVDVEETPRLQIAKKSMWQSIFDNPKVLFIAFFASYVSLIMPTMSSGRCRRAMSSFLGC
jgi:hypothetical protein